jgi:hypothetical protein
MHEMTEDQLLEGVAGDHHLDITFLSVVSAATEAARQEKSMNTELYRGIMDFKLNPTNKFLVVKKNLMDRTVALAANYERFDIVGRDAMIHTFIQAFLAELLGAEYGVLQSPDKLSHPVFSLRASMDTFGPFRCVGNNIDDAGLRDVRALSDFTMLGCIHGGAKVPQQFEINVFDSACILQRIPEECRVALSSHLYIFPRRNTYVELAVILQPLLYEDHVEGPILANMMDGAMTFVPGSLHFPTAVRGIASLYNAIDCAKADGHGHTIDFGTGDTLILKKQAVLYTKECVDDPTPVLMGGPDRELVRSYWLSTRTFAKMNDNGLLYHG